MGETSWWANVASGGLIIEQAELDAKTLIEERNRALIKDLIETVYQRMIETWKQIDTGVRLLRDVSNVNEYLAIKA